MAEVLRQGMPLDGLGARQPESEGGEVKRPNYYRAGLEAGWRSAVLRRNPSNFLVCSICKRKFIRRGKRKFSAKLVCCSIACKAKSQIGNIIPGFNLKPKSGRVILCKTCGKPRQRAPSQTGKYCCRKCRENDASSFDAMRGSNHYNWKGGIGPKNQLARRSLECKRWKMAVVKRDGCCRWCGTKVGLQSHHRFPWAEFPLMRYDVENGITLCKSCHRALHIFGKLGTRAINAEMENA